MIQFHMPPPLSVWRTATKRSRGGPIPRIEARAARLPGDVTAYAAITNAQADPLPIGWPAVATAGLQFAVLAHEAFPHRLMGLVHARQVIRRHRAIRAGEHLSGRCVVEGERVVRSGGEFDMVTTVYAGDELVWEGVTTAFTRSIRGHGGPKLAPAPTPDRRVTHEESWSLPADLGRRYSRVAGDRNPIHLWPVTAWPFGFSRPIIHGWWTLARALSAIGPLPDACTVEARFVAPVPLPCTATLFSGPDGDATWFEVRRDGPCVIGRVRAGV
jgi:hypothetical protein